MNDIFYKKIDSLTKRNRFLKGYIELIENKKIDKKVELAYFCKRKGIKNFNLFINTLKYFHFDTQLFDEFDIDLLHYVMHLTFFKDEDYKNYTENDYTRRQKRELNKLDEINRKIFSSSVCWKEIKIRSNSKQLHLKNNAEIFIKIREELLLDYIKYLGRR